MKKKPAKPPPGEQALGVMRVRLTKSAEWEDEYERLLFLPVGVEGVVLKMQDRDNVVVCWDYVVCDDKVYRQHTTDVYTDAVAFVRFDSVFGLDRGRKSVRTEPPSQGLLDDDDTPF